MAIEKRNSEKIRLHTRNKNRDRYDLEALVEVQPELKEYIKPNKYGENSVDFSNPKAVKFLNKALLNHYYGIKNWDFADGNLTPPIPGRADYLHYAADLLTESNFGQFDPEIKLTCLDIGVGANCIYPLIGVAEYGWNFIGSDADEASIESAEKIVEANALQDKIELRTQPHKQAIFEGIINRDEKIDITISNPPFHATAEEAAAGSLRKVENLKGNSTTETELNFSGISEELVYEGGEYKFIENMIWESKKFGKNCFWFSTLVSKKSNLKAIYKLLEIKDAVKVKTIPMGTGNKSTRIVAWTFLSNKEQKEWRETRWRIAATEAQESCCHTCTKKSADHLL